MRHRPGASWRARLGAHAYCQRGDLRAAPRVLPAPSHPTTSIDDFVVPMRARKLGFRVVFDPEAEGVEFAGESVKDEFTRRVAHRGSGSFRALRELSQVGP